MNTKTRLYTKYKTTGIEWLNQIPNDWEITKLFDIYIQKKEFSNKEEELLSVYRDYGVIPKSSRDDNNNKPSEDLSKYILVKPGDLVINKMKAWQGSVAVSQYRGIVSPAYFKYKQRENAKNRIYLPYLHHLLRSTKYIETYRRFSRGIRPSQWDLDPYQFKVLPILLPGHETQKHIADYLDEKTKIIDQLIEKKQKLIELLREKRAAVITQAVTKGLDPKAKMKPSGVEWLGDIPEGWNTRKGKYLFQFKKEINKKYQCDHILALTLRGVINKEDYEESSLVPTDYASYQIFSKGDLVFKLIDLENYQTSRVGIVPQKGIMSPAYIRIVPNKNINSTFYYWVYFSLYIQGIFNFLGMGVRSTLNKWDLLSQFIQLPAQEDQEMISDYLNKNTKKIDKSILLILQQINKLKEYRSSLIYSAVTGKIKV